MVVMRTLVVRLRSYSSNGRTMITYQYRCRSCEKITDAVREIEDRENAPECECGGKTRKIISLYHVHSDMKPYWDDNLQTHIQGKQHRQRVMKEQGVSENFGQNWHTSSVKRRKVG